MKSLSAWISRFVDLKTTGFPATLSPWCALFRIWAEQAWWKRTDPVYSQ